MSTKVALPFLLHYLSFMVFLVLLTADLAYIDLPPHHTYAGRMKFLTFLSFCADLAYFNMAAIIDFLIWSRGKDSPLWRKVRDFVFTTIIFPYATFVCVMFWAIYLHDPHHLRSDDEMKIIPWWVDHGFHTLPILTMFLHAYLIEHIYPRKRIAFLSLLLADIAYICWLFWIAYKANFWVYPLLARMSFPVVLLFISVLTMISFAFYLSGKKFHDLVWKNGAKKNS